MTIRKVEVERFSVTSSKPFEAVVAALEAAVGKPDMVEFAKITGSARTFAELERAVSDGLGRTGLMLFMKLDLGALVCIVCNNHSRNNVRHLELRQPWYLRTGLLRKEPRDPNRA